MTSVAVTSPGADVRSTNGDAPAGPSETTPLLVGQPPRWRVNNDRTARARLQPYLDRAVAQQKYQYRLSKFIKYGINFVILLQVTVGAAVTLMAVFEPTKSTRFATAGLGSLGTITAAILARAKLKGTGQPELAQAHSRDLERFIGQCELFVGDVGSASGPEIDAQVMEFVRQFDAIEDSATRSACNIDGQTSTESPV